MAEGSQALHKRPGPTTPLDRRMSRNECVRRLLLGGLTSLQATSAADQKQIADAYARSVQPPPDRTPTLPWSK